MHIILLGLIILILVFILLFDPLNNGLVTHGPDEADERSQRPEPQLETPGETQRPLVSRDQRQNGSPRQDDQPVQGTREGHTLNGLIAEISRWEHANAERMKELEIARKNVAKLQRDLSTSIAQNAELQHRYETLSNNLEGVRLFLNTADAFADSEVAQMLRKLNAELQHMSTFMAERVVSIFKLGAIVPDPKRETMESRASESISLALLELLRTAGPDDPDVPMYLQIAFQAYLAHHLCWIVTCWSPDKACNVFVNGIYQRLREKENQGISGRWRSLTCAYVSPAPVSEPNSFVTPIILGLSDILSTAGCAASYSDIISELSSMFEKKIVSAVSLAGRLNQAIGGVVSGDFEVFVVQHGEAYQGEAMEEDTDASGDEVRSMPGGTGVGQAVLCTSELGLTKRVQLETGERETKTVIKAKVILESFLRNGD